MDSNVSSASFREISLSVLLEGAWAERWVVFAVTAMVTSLASLYALTATPIYQTSAGVLPPRQIDVGELNVVRLSVGAASGSTLEEISPDDVFQSFKRHLLSSSLRTEFFEQHYLPYLGERSSLDESARDALLNHFRNVLTIRRPVIQDRPDYYEVTVELDDPVLAAEWANRYVVRAGEVAAEEMINVVEDEIRMRARVLSTQIRSLREAARREREDRIVQLREALQVAYAIGIEAPQVTAGRVNSDSELAAFVEGNLMYLRGSVALQAELDVLQSREVDDPFTPELRELEARLVLLRSVEVDPDSVGTYSIDGLAEITNTPVKPKRASLIALGVVLGVILGCFTALVRVAYRSRLALSS